MRTCCCGCVAGVDPEERELEYMQAACTAHRLRSTSPALAGPETTSWVPAVLWPGPLRGHR